MKKITSIFFFVFFIFCLAYIYLERRVSEVESDISYTIKKYGVFKIKSNKFFSNADNGDVICILLPYQKIDDNDVVLNSKYGLNAYSGYLALKSLYRNPESEWSLFLSDGRGIKSRLQIRRHHIDIKIDKVTGKCFPAKNAALRLAGDNNQQSSMMVEFYKFNEDR